MNRKILMCGQVVNIPTDCIGFESAATDFMLCVTNEIDTISVAIHNNFYSEM